MDSSGLPLASSNSITSNRKPKAEVSTMVQSKRAKLFATYHPQDFSLPDSIMFYLVKNPTSPKLYKKIIQTCKYFFFQNPILVIYELCYSDDDKCRFSKIGPINLSKIASNLWITDRLFVHLGYSGNKKDISQNILSSVMLKLYKCDAKFIVINNQVIYFRDLSLLFSSAEEIVFRNVTVKDENGLNVGIEKIVEVAVKGEWISIFSDKSVLNITSETMKKLVKLPHFLNLHELKMTSIPEAFDLETFYGYMKKNKTTKFYLTFADSISDSYKNRLEEIIDEIIATENRDYKPPFIDFNGLDREKKDKLHFSH